MDLASLIRLGVSWIISLENSWIILVGRLINTIINYFHSISSQLQEPVRRWSIKAATLDWTTSPAAQPGHPPHDDDDGHDDDDDDDDDDPDDDDEDGHLRLLTGAFVREIGVAQWGLGGAEATPRQQVFQTFSF